MTCDLPPALIAISAPQDGVFTRAQAIGCGMSPDEFRRAVSTRTIARVRRGAYVPNYMWETAGQATRQRYGLRAMTLQADGPVVGSHDTAAAVLGLELWEQSYEWIHLTRPLHSARREARVWHHNASLRGDDIVVVAALTVTSPLRTALDVARGADFEHGLVAIDSALRLTQSSVEHLREMHLRSADWNGARTAGRAVAHADGRSGSVGESRLRAKLAFGGLPEPITQVSVYDETQRLVGIVDFLIDGKVVLEFDGRTKYGLYGLTPEATADQLWREKQREDALRRLGYEVVRLTWADLYHLERIVALIRAALSRATASPSVRGTIAVEPLRRATPG